jgi:multicomponent Na+:H+ antiporter subunit D
VDALALSVAVPLGTAGLLVTIGTWVRGRAADLIALAAVVAAAALLAVSLGRVGAGIGVYWFGAWEPRQGIALGIDFTADAIGLGLGLFIALLMAAALVSMWRYRDTDAPHFQVLLLVFFAGMAGFALAGDLFNMFVFFEVMSVASFALSGYLVEDESVEGALNYAITNTIGSFLFLIGVGLIYARTGALNLAQIGESLAAGPHDGLVVVAFALLASAFLIKAAIVPFHFWLSDAYAVAPTPVCLLFAGAMSELGVYGVGRLWFTAFGPALADHADEMRTVLVVAGCLTALLGAVMCLAQQNLKRMLAFATISYSGIALIGVGLLESGGIAAAALYTVADGFAKAALFAAVGIVVNRLGGPAVRLLQGRGRALGAAAALVTAVGALSLLAIPPFGSFYAKAMLEEALTSTGFGWAIAVLVLTAGLTTAAIVAAAARVFLDAGEPLEHGGPAEEEGQKDQQEEVSAPEGRTPASLAVPAVALAAGALACGLVADLFTAVETAAERFVDTAGYAGAVLRDAAPAAIAKPPAFEPKSSAYLFALATAAVAVVATAISLHRSRAREILGERVAALGRRPLGGLRALHSGHVGDYVAFLCVGVALLGGGFAIAAG